MKTIKLILNCHSRFVFKKSLQQKIMLDNIKIAVVQLAVISSFINHVSSDILVYSSETHNIEMEFKDVPSRFGDAIPLDGIRVSLFKLKILAYV